MMLLKSCLDFTNKNVLARKTEHKQGDGKNEWRSGRRMVVNITLHKLI